MDFFEVSRGAEFLERFRVPLESSRSALLTWSVTTFVDLVAEQLSSPAPQKRSDTIYIYIYIINNTIISLSNIYIYIELYIFIYFLQN